MELSREQVEKIVAVQVLQREGTADALLAHDQAQRDRIRTATQLIIAEIGASGPEDLEDAVGRIVAKLQQQAAALAELQAEQSAEGNRYRELAQEIAPPGTPLATEGEISFGKLREVVEAALAAVEQEREALEDDHYFLVPNADTPITWREEAERLKQELEQARSVNAATEPQRYWANKAAALKQQLTDAQAMAKELRGAITAQDMREKQAGDRCGVDYAMWGCDWPDQAADKILELRATIQRLTKEREAHNAECYPLGLRIKKRVGNLQQRVTALEADNKRLAEERDTLKRLYERGKEALRRPCLQCGYVQNAVTALAPAAGTDADAGRKA